MNVKRRAVFFDKDGVINEPVDRGEGFVAGGKAQRFTAPFVLSELHFFEGIAETVARLKERGFLVIVATNQPDVTYGLMKKNDLAAILAKIKELGFDDIFVCTHGRGEGCECKKPKPGLLLDAAARWNIDLARSYMMGDTGADMGAARAAGCRAVLLERPYNAGTEADLKISTVSDILTLV